MKATMGAQGMTEDIIPSTTAVVPQEHSGVPTAAAVAMATLPRALPVEVMLFTEPQCARRELHPTMGITEEAEGGALLRGSASELDWYARELMRLPFRFAVREPDALRVAVAEAALALAAEHGGGPAAREPKVPLRGATRSRKLG